MKRKILVTGFEPFGGDEVNPSGDIAKSLDGFEVAGHRVVSAIMPVEWGTVQSRLESLIDEVEPAVVLSLGLSAGRAEISVEKVAVNYTSKSKDNAGVIPVERSIIQGRRTAILPPSRQKMRSGHREGWDSRSPFAFGGRVPLQLRLLLRVSFVQAEGRSAEGRFHPYTCHARDGGG